MSEQVWQPVKQKTSYSKDGPFNEPVVRCDACQRLLLLAKLKESGACRCGCRKVRNIRAFTPEEAEKMKGWGVDPDYMKLFEAVEDD